MTATDSDCGSNSILTYTLEADGVAPPANFTINSETGVISLRSKLDYEAKQLHEFAVMAVDRGNYRQQLKAATISDALIIRIIFIELVAQSSNITAVCS